MQKPIHQTAQEGQALPDRLDERAVALAMAPRARNAIDLHVVETTGSTNADLLAAAHTLPSGHVLAAEIQTAGRGRRGRVWQSAPRALTFSLLWRFRRGAGGLSGLSLAVGLGVACALERCGATGVMLKWPNDLLARHGGGWAKLGGILIEISAGSTGPAGAVIGIGINIGADVPVLATGKPAIGLAALGVALPRNLVLARILEELLQVLGAFDAAGFAPLSAAWNARHAFRDLPVTLTGDGVHAMTGIARGVDADGALQVDTPAGTSSVISGEVSLRLAGPT